MVSILTQAEIDRILIFEINIKHEWVKNKFQYFRDEKLSIDELKENPNIRDAIIIAKEIFDNDNPSYYIKTMMLADKPNAIKLTLETKKGIINLTSRNRILTFFSNLYDVISKHYPELVI